MLAPGNPSTTAPSELEHLPFSIRDGQSSTLAKQDYLQVKDKLGLNPACSESTAKEWHTINREASRTPQVLVIA